MAQLFADAQAPLAVVVSGAVSAVWILLVELRLRALATGGRSQVRGMRRGWLDAVAVRHSVGSAIRLDGL